MPEKDKAWSRYFLAELKAGNELSSAWKLRKAFKLTTSAIADFPDFYPNYKTLGIMQCLLGAVPENMQWVPGLFGMEGSLENGLVNLNLAGDKVPWLRKETTLLLALCHSYLLSDDDRALTYAESLLADESGPLPVYLMMNVFLRSHSAAMAIEAYEALTVSEQNNLILLKYLKGNALLQAGKYSEAIKTFNEFISGYAGEEFIKDAWYKTGIAYFLMGKPDMSDKILLKVSEVGNSHTEADRYAHIHSQKPLHSQIIMKLRLYTDGGFFKKAKEMASSASPDDFTTRESKTEFIYRSGRLAHITGDSDKAVELYLQTIKEQGDEKWYYAPNSCLQLGYIFLKTSPEKSESYFLKVRDYRGYDYEKGIERKAQAALNRYF